MADLEFMDGFVCPACKKKNVKAFVFKKDGSFYAKCGYCKELDNPVVVVRYKAEDKITREFIQKYIDQNWILVKKYEEHFCKK